MEFVLIPERARDANAAHDRLAAMLGRVASGDEGALRAIYDATSAQVFGTCLSILRDRTAAEEALVEVFAQVWRQAGRFDRARGSVESWIGTLARTRSIDLRRARVRERERSASLELAHAESVNDPGARPDEVSSASERTARVARALAALPLEQRRAVEAAFFGGLSHTEVAQALGQPLGTVKTRIRSGLSALRRSLSTAESELT